MQLLGTKTLRAAATNFHLIVYRNICSGMREKICSFNRGKLILRRKFGVAACSYVYFILEFQEFHSPCAASWASLSPDVLGFANR